ncbi:RelA/SpoT family protein [Patescibacteria group bacterium]|nr:RelA/SpoT family protein [Patescibacteria group bacterium]
MSKAPKIENLILKNERIKKAYNLATRIHQGQKRKNGEPYFNHVLATAETVAEWELDETSIIAALLHDSVEDTNYSLEEIKKEFGEEVSFLVDGVTKLGKIKYRGIERQVENLLKMMLALSQDLRVIIIKLADRFHNMKTLSALPPQKQKRIALETSEIYASLAYRLGMQWISGELEDLAFPYIYPKEYRWLIDNIKEKYEERTSYTEKTKPIIEEKLENAKIEVLKIDSRAKRYSSLYKKLLRYDMDIEKIHDLIALRIIVKNIEDCYAVLGVIHNNWPPLPNRIKDYIALPKPNGYRGLHTTVFFIENKITEIQIKTQGMHEEAETGIAAHWAYELSKDTKKYMDKQPSFANKRELQWINQLKNWQNEFSNPEEFLESLKIDFFKDRIFVITPKGRVIDLPADSTPVDFAYQIHTDIGNSCSGAKVNGKIVSLNYVLNSGDLVEIHTQKNKKASESWLDFVKSTNARSNIRSSLKESGKKLISKEINGSEVKIIAEDNIGVLKEITKIFSRNRVNISSINTFTNAKFPVIKFKCDVTDRRKIEKLILKLKVIPSIKEINYHMF